MSETTEKYKRVNRLMVLKIHLEVPKDTKLLTLQTNKDAQWALQITFKFLKKAFSTAPILKQREYQLLSIIHTDASNYVQYLPKEKLKNRINTGAAYQLTISQKQRSRVEIFYISNHYKLRPIGTALLISPTSRLAR